MSCDFQHINSIKPFIQEQSQSKHVLCVTCIIHSSAKINQTLGLTPLRHNINILQRHTRLRLSHLPTVTNALCKDAVVITNAVTIGGETERCHGVEEAGCEATQTAVAQSCIIFNIFQLFNIKTNLRQDQIIFCHIKDSIQKQASLTRNPPSKTINYSKDSKDTSIRELLWSRDLRADLVQSLIDRSLNSKIHHRVGQ